MTLSRQFRIIVAHYNENLGWLEDDKDVTIYSKGKCIRPHIKLPNIGREGHTYVHYLVNNYDALPEITIFLQGHIDDHVNLGIKQIKSIAAETQPGQVVTFPWRLLETFDHWNGIPWEDYPCWQKWSAMGVADTGKTPAQYWKTLFPNRPLPKSIGFLPAALFAVHRDTIRQYPKSFYELLMEEMFGGSLAHVNPMTGHYLERFWLAIFNPREYILYPGEQPAKEQYNKQGQLSKGNWHVTPKGVLQDPAILPPGDMQ